MPPEVFHARYESRCAVCGDTIYPDDEIALLPEEDEWVHAACAIEDGEP